MSAIGGSVYTGDMEKATYDPNDDGVIAVAETEATDDQTGAEIKTLYQAQVNAYTDTKNTKLNGIETAATADQTGAQIKTAYQAEANAYTDTKNTKLSGIDTGADVTGNNAPQAHNQSAATITTGTLADERGGTGQSTYAQGDLLYASVTNVVSKLAKGTDNHVLTMNGNVPNWEAAAGGASVPSGCILMWHGLIANIPAGYYLCNGANSTPDLRSRFLRGAPNGVEAGGTGGSDTHTLVTSEIPAHIHSISDILTTGPSGNGGYTTSQSAVGNSPDTDSTGGGGSHNNMPAYYQILYIMKS